MKSPHLPLRAVLPAVRPARWHLIIARDGHRGIDVYRHTQLKAPDYVALNGKMILQIPPDGDAGTGCFYGNLQVQVGDCYAEFEVSERVIDAKVFADGSMKVRNAAQSRQRIRLEGNPPQRDGFEPDFRGAREIDLFFHCPPDEPGVLRGRYSSEVGGNIYSKQPESGTGSSFV